MVGREGWKSMVVNKLMDRGGALAWYQEECDVGNVRIELIRGGTGWSNFEEREAKSMVKWLLRVVLILCKRWVEHV